MKVILAALIIGLLSSAIVLAQAPIRLWSGPIPGATGTTDNDVPTLTPYLPNLPANAPPAPAMVICPGGGYSGLATDHEGTAYAKWLNQYGIAGFVVKYRLGSHGYRNPIEQEDADRAIRMVRANATMWNINPEMVGIMGSSAGGHLAATVLTHNDAGDAAATDPIDRQSCKPTIGILCYPVITMTAPYTHTGSRDNLLGSDPSPALVNLLSAEQQVTSQTPPTFVWCTADDNVVPSMNSLLFAESLAKNGVTFELHIYPHGPHGLGLGDDNPPFTGALPWTHDLLRWLQLQHFAPAQG